MCPFSKDRPSKWTTSRASIDPAVDMALLVWPLALDVIACCICIPASGTKFAVLSEQLCCCRRQEQLANLARVCRAGALAFLLNSKPSYCTCQNIYQEEGIREDRGICAYAKCRNLAAMHYPAGTVAQDIYQSDMRKSTSAGEAAVASTSCINVTSAYVARRANAVQAGPSAEVWQACRV